MAPPAAAYSCRAVPASLRRLLRLAGASFALVLSIWFAAVRNLGRVKRRKRVRRQLRRGE